LRTASLWLVWFGVNFSYYGAFIWLPTLLVASGMGLGRSFGFTLVITLAQLPGYATAAVLVELWGRRPTLSLFLVGSAGSAVAFGLADSTTTMVAGGMALSFFNLGAWGALYAITPEIYPTLLRATGAGWAAGFGRIASILAPLSVPPLLKIGDNLLVFVVFAAFFLLAATFTWGLPERRGDTVGDRAGLSPLQAGSPHASRACLTDPSARTARCWRSRPCAVVAGVFVVAGLDRTPPLEIVERALDHVASGLDLRVEDWGPVTGAALLTWRLATWSLFSGMTTAIPLPSRACASMSSKQRQQLRVVPVLAGGQPHRQRPTLRTTLRSTLVLHPPGERPRA